MKVLALSSYPAEAAATRFRIEQLIEPLKERGIEIELSPFLDAEAFKLLYKQGSPFAKLKKIASGLTRRTGLLFGLRGYDLLFVQREAMFFGPAVFEWLYQRFGRLPLVLDLDDATYVRYESPTYGRAGSLLKFFGKTDRLIDRASVVICGNRYIADHVEQRGGKGVIVPTVVSEDVFTPAERSNDPPVIGWIGTHSTYPFVARLFPILRDLAKKHDFILRIVGAGTTNIFVEGMTVDAREWTRAGEADEFSSLDIGLYPIDTSSSLDPAWLAGKSGFKAIQYLASGVPFVMSPVGVCSEIGEPGRTHFNAVSDADWYTFLDRLLSDSELRQEMGRKGRDLFVARYDIRHFVDVVASALRSAAA